MNISCPRWKQLISTSPSQDVTVMHRLFPSDFFNFEALRLLSFAPYEGGEIAEFLEAVARIRDLDVESWFEVWSALGEKTAIAAQDAEKASNRSAARRAFFRASNYLRAAQFMLNGPNPSQDSRILETSERSNSLFNQAQELMDATVHELNIPYQDITLPGYLYLPHPSKRLPGKLPLLLQTVGGDATQQEIFYILPYEALDLGYACITFDGPGQGIVLRRNKLPMRPDWEAVITPVIDFIYAYVAEHPETNLDLDCLALAGSSVGGYLALRGASDSRVKACVSIDPFYSMWDLLKGRTPDFLISSFESGSFTNDWAWESIFGALCALNVQTRWEFHHLRWIFDRDSATSVLRRMMDFTFATADGSNWLEKVRCPVFVTGAAYSIYAKPEISTERIYACLEHLGDENRTSWIPRGASDGGLQSKIGAFGRCTLKTFTWLDRVFGIDRQLSPNHI